MPYWMLEIPPGLTPLEGVWVKYLDPKHLEHREGGDFTLICEGRKLKAHSYILAARSPYFRTAFSTPLSTEKSKFMEIGWCSSEVLDEVLDMMYGVGLTKNFPDLAGLLEAAEMFLMEDLKEEVAQELSKRICVQNHEEIGQLAQVYSIKWLSEKCDQYCVAP